MRTLKLLGLGLIMTGCGGSLDVGKDQPATGGSGGSVESGSGGKAGIATGGASTVSAGGVFMGTAGSGDPEPSVGGKHEEASSGGKSIALSGGKPGEEVGYGGKNSAGSPPVVPQPLPTWRTNCDGAKAVNATGVWEGQTEDDFFRPIQKYRVEIAGLLDGALCGTLLVDPHAEPIAPASDATGVYPPGNDPVQSKGTVQDLIPGMTYTLADGAVRGNAVRFQVTVSEAHRTWCELQTAYEVRPNEYACLPGSSWGVGFEPGKDPLCTVTSADGKELHPTVAQCYQCMYCVCAAEGCTAFAQGNRLADLTLTEDDVLVGPFNNGTLVLSRVAPPK